MKYMVVDDEPFALEDLEETLKEAAPDCTLYSFTFSSKALDHARTEKIDVAFLDIEMGSVNGLVLAKQLKDIQPDIHIIFVTGYEQYALAAIRMHATGYLTKPATVEDIRRELTFLYGETPKEKQTIRVQTFGGFAVFVNEEPVIFSRAKSKELLAYLVDRRGGAVTTAGACLILWEDQLYDRKLVQYFQTIVYELRQSLRDAGIEDILIRSRNSLAINTSKIVCDSYQFMEGVPSAVNSYRNDYLLDYSWSEFSIANLEK
ncbi:MAG: response regulator [bacterium]|nr:response regulator [bacterium]